MCVTSPVRDEISYTDEWTVKAPDTDTAITKYNNNRNRFMFFPWGIWVTGYARRNLWTGIVEFGHDYIYSDTDSLKVVNFEDHREYVEQYNKKCAEKLKAACRYHHIPFAMTEPETIKGIKKPLGVWDHDGTYKRFKTLGAKRYMVEYEDGTINITVSGLNKKRTVPYINQMTGGDNDKAFAFFNRGMYIPGYYTGKSTHTYLDEPVAGTMTDHTGLTAQYREASGIHLEPADYDMSVAAHFVDYIRGINEEAVNG